MIDFLTLKRPQKPNSFLACTEDHCLGTAADMIAPIHEVPLAGVREAWDRVVSRSPRVERTAQSADGWQAEYIQRSKVFGFPDEITVRFIAEPQEAGAEPATRVLVFSRSLKGYYDFGVNKRRVRAWLEALERELKKTS